MTNLHEQEQRAQILVEQTDRLLTIFDVDLSSVSLRDPAHTAWAANPAVFRLAADAYDKLAQAQKLIDPVLWERTTERNGRNGDELMKLLWALLEEIRKG